MNLRKNRRLNPNPKGVILGYVSIGLLVSGLFFYGWSQFALTRMQRQCFTLYAEASAPFVKTVSMNAVRKALGDNIVPGDKSRVAKGPIHATLHDMTYKGQPITAVIALPAKVSGGILLAFVIAGIVNVNRQRRALENGIILRGPELMSIRQFNKAAKGKVGIELHAHEVIES